MSRVIVKNIPKYADEKRVRDHFASRGAITDVKVMRTKSGKSRCFGFVGFKSEEEAQDAVKHFDKSFMDTARLSVLIARPVGDPGIPRTWSKHTRTDGAADEGQNGQGGGAQPHKHRHFMKEEENDAELREFLEVMKPRSTQRTWNNDAEASAAAAAARDKAKGVAEGEGKEEEGASAAAKEEARKLLGGDGSDEEYEEVEAGAAGGAGGVEEEESDDEEEEEESEEEEEEAADNLAWLKRRAKPLEGEEKDEGDEEDEEDEEEGGGAVSRAATAGGSTESAGRLSDTSEESDSHSDSEGEGEEGSKAAAGGKKDAAAAAAAPQADVADTGRLFVRNLPFLAEEEDVKNAFAPFGTVLEVHLPRDDANRPKGFAYVQFAIPAHAVRALADLDGSVFQGRLLHVLPARASRVAQEDKGKAAGTYKEKNEQERKKQAGDSTNWNPFYVNQATVVEAVAEKLGVEKGELLNRDESGSAMAVQLALAETQVIADTRKMLEEEGVSIPMLEAAARGEKVPRSTTVLLAKNLPYQTGARELEELFGRFGTLSRCVFPPSRSMALAEFSNAGEAKTAFRALAYKKFKHLPLYLEFAPEGMFQRAADPTRAAKAADSAAAGAVKDVLETEEASAASDSADSRTLFVKNLNFTTTDDAFRGAFKGVKGLRSAKVARKRDVQKTGATNSLGYGFLEFVSRDAAMEVLKTRQGTVLDGHKLDLKLARAPQPKARSTTRQVTWAGRQPEGQAGCKITVKNVAFEATRKELRELFGTYGKLKAVRLPLKFDGSHRGFAFVEFLTRQEAAAAMEALAATHLYGRKLVVEWSEAKDEVQAARERATVDYAAASEAQERQRTARNRKRARESNQ